MFRSTACKKVVTSPWMIQRVFFASNTQTVKVSLFKIFETPTFDSELPLSRPKLSAKACSMRASGSPAACATCGCKPGPAIGLAEVFSVKSTPS